MKKSILIPILLVFIFSCSPDEETQAPTNSVQTTTPEPEPVVVQYTLTVSAGDGGNVTNGGTFDEGTDVTITATPNEGYRFIGWSDGSSADSLSITVNSDITITANFEQIPTYTLTLIAEGGTVEGEGEYEEGTEVTLTAIANNEYRFTGWSDGETGLTRTVVIIIILRLLHILKVTQSITVFIMIIMN